MFEFQINNGKVLKTSAVKNQFLAAEELSQFRVTGMHLEELDITSLWKAPNRMLTFRKPQVQHNTMILFIDLQGSQTKVMRREKCKEGSDKSQKAETELKRKPPAKSETHEAFVSSCDQQEVTMTHGVQSPLLRAPIYPFPGFYRSDLCRESHDWSKNDCGLFFILIVFRSLKWFNISISKADGVTPEWSCLGGWCHVVEGHPG